MPHRHQPSIPARVIGLCKAQKHLVIQPEGHDKSVVLEGLSASNRLRALFNGSVHVVRNPINTGSFLFREVPNTAQPRLGH